MMKSGHSNTSSVAAVPNSSNFVDGLGGSFAKEIDRISLVSRF